MNSGHNEKGRAAATQAAEFLAALMQDNGNGEGNGNGGGRRGAITGVERAANRRPEEAAATKSPKTDKQATPAMATESCSESETSERARERDSQRDIE